MRDNSVLLHWLLFLLVLLWMQRRKLRHFIKALRQEWKERFPRRWKAQSPHHCRQCRAGLRLEAMRAKADIQPYSQRKSRRGRKKRVATGGYACPNANCDYRGVTDSGVHALVGYGTPNGIQRLKCQACAKVFTCQSQHAAVLPQDRRKRSGIRALVPG